jgi:hypothetical protein
MVDMGVPKPEKVEMDDLSLHLTELKSRGFKGIPRSYDLQTKEYFRRYEEENDELKSPDQHFILHSFPTEIKQFVFSIEIGEGKLQ